MVKMKFLFVLVAIGATTFANAQPPALAPLLTDYYNVKDALVRSDPAAAATKAAGLFNAVNSADTTALAPDDRKAFLLLKEKLAFEAGRISKTTFINYQRQYFASLSAAMAALARQAHLSETPVFEDYCPMSKNIWLSNETAIRNPYFGNRMLTCGKVTATLKP